MTLSRAAAAGIKPLLGTVEELLDEGLVSRATIEEEILSLHEGKRDLVAGVLDGTDQAGKLSTADLVGLIRSGGEA